MRTLTIILICLCINVILSAQSYNLSGKITDSNNNQKIETATVVLISPKDSSYIDGVLTDSLGKYTLGNIPNGNYLIQVSYVGYETLTDLIELQNKDFIKDYALTSNSLLGEVVVKAKRPIITRKIDRIVFNVQESPLLKTGNGMDAISAAPAVFIGSNGNIRINGSIASIYVNDIPLRIEADAIPSYLASLSAANIEKIEIITNPPAKYEAADGAILNIILKKSNLGFEGNINLNYSQGIEAKFGEGISLSYGSNKWSIYSSYNHNHGTYLTQGEENTFFETGNWSTVYDTKYKGGSHSYRAGLDYIINKNHKISLQYGGYKVDGSSNGISNTEIKSENNIDSLLESTKLFLNNRIQNSLNLNYKITLDTTGKNITIYSNTLSYDNFPGQSFSNSAFDENQNKIRPDVIYNRENSQKIDLAAIAFDYFHPFSNGSELEFGSKVSRVKTEDILNKEEVFGIIPNFDFGQNTNFLYLEKNYGLYASYYTKIGDKLELKMGARGEYTESNGKAFVNDSSVDINNDNNYFKLFPTAYLQYTVTDDFSINLTYSKRISRPGFSKLKPFKTYNNPYTSFRGNPFLLPNIINNYGMSLNYKEHMLNLYYYTSNNEFEEIIFQDNDSQTVDYSIINFTKKSGIGFWSYFPFEIKDWWRFQLSVSMSYNLHNHDYLSSTINNKQLTFYIKTTNRFNLSTKQKLKLELTSWYRSKSIQGLLVTQPRFDLSIGISKSFFNDKLSLSAAATDLLNKQSSWVNVDYLDQQHDFIERYDTRRFRLSLYYNFGISRDELVNKKSSIEDEKYRL